MFWVSIFMMMETRSRMIMVVNRMTVCGIKKVERYIIGSIIMSPGDGGSK